MKKLFGIIVAAMLLISSTFAVEMVIGARGNVNFGVGTSLEDDGKELVEELKLATALASVLGVDAQLKEKGNLGVGIALYGNFQIPILKSAKLGFQPEINFNFNNGYNIDFSVSADGYEASDKIRAYTHTLDIPLIINVSFPLGSMFELGGGMGPQLSIPLKADVEEILKSTEESKNTKLINEDTTVKGNVNFGIVFDINAKLLGPEKNAALIFDLRYILDITKTKFIISNEYFSETIVLFTRRGLDLGLGLEYRF